MRITLVTGGARSGKTRHALALASAAAARLGSEVSYLATAATGARPAEGAGGNGGRSGAGGADPGTRPAAPGAQPAAPGARSAAHPGPHPDPHPDPHPNPDPDPSPDPEMARRIARHRAERPATWETLELGDAASRDAGTGAASALLAARHPVVLLDCLTLLLTGAILGPGEPSGEGEVETRARGAVEALLTAAATRRGELLVVTNEVGMGIVPISPLGRWFRDAQGRANQRVAGVAEEVILLVSGIPVQVKGEGGRRSET